MTVPHAGDGAHAAATIAETANQPNVGVLNRLIAGRQAE